ncbi:MAG: D-cysteine desulfhydrase family protein [Alphaproteobacteria bacterium]|nr:D-cysteine desulfhydrase family protein [Alphaproteobacteria bacterium]
MTRKELLERLAARPRVKLAHLPTPLDHAPRFRDALAGRTDVPDIWVKRDDMTGLAFGGNKTRQLEFVFADMLAEGADVLVAGAYTQSNWCRQMTAACRKLGLDIALVLLHGEKGPALQGNLLLDHLMGADITVVDLETMEDLQPLLDTKGEELRRAGRKPYVIKPLGVESLAIGALGYVGAAIELDEQLEALGVAPRHLYVCGANMTPAGMALGFKALGRDIRLVNITPIRWSEPRADDIVRIGNAAAELLDLDVRLGVDDFESHDDYIGARYGVVSEGGREALKLIARTEGLILDPVYSSKALAGLIDHVRTGRFSRDDTVLFMHTGGMPALFAYADDLRLA